MAKKSEREHDDRCDCALGIPMSRWKADADSNDGLTARYSQRLMEHRMDEAIRNGEYPRVIEDYARLIAMFGERVNEAVQEVFDAIPPRPLCRNPMCDKKECVGC